MAAILQSESSCLAHWLSYLSHRCCKARSHLERLSYFVHNQHITAERFYQPLLQQFLQAWQGMPVTLTLDTSLFWEQYCLIEVCLVWGGRSFPLAQQVIEHRSAMVAFEDYRCVLDTAAIVVPSDCFVTLLADRGFEHGELIRWARARQWSWAIRAKSDLSITFASGNCLSVAELLPPAEQANLFHHVTILEDIECHLATATLSVAQESWAVIMDCPPSLQTFAIYGQRFGGIEPHFKDYQSAAFGLPRSRLREANALKRLMMLLATATIIALSISIEVLFQGQLQTIDWHGQRGLSFLQIGLRQLHRLSYLGEPIPKLESLPRCNPPPACASIKKKQGIETRIKFAKVTTTNTFSASQLFCTTKPPDL